MTKPKNKNQGSNSFSNAVLRTMIASDPAVSYASGWNWSNNGVTQRRTKESDQLADNLVTVALSAPISPETILAEKVVGSAAKYGLKSTVAGDMLRQNIRNATLATSEPLLNVGWGPKQTLKVFRAGEYDQMYFPER